MPVPVQIVLLPVLAGVAIREVVPAAVAPLRPLCTLASAALLALSFGSYIAHASAFVAATGAAAVARAAWPRLLAAVTAWHAGALGWMLHLLRLQQWTFRLVLLALSPIVLPRCPSRPTSCPPCFHPAAGFALGYALPRALGLPEAAARSHAIQTGQRNSVLASQLALASFPAHPLAAVPCAVSACVHTALGGLVAAYWAERPAADELGSNSSDEGSSAYPSGMLSSLLWASSTEVADAAKAAAQRARSAVSSLQALLQSTAAAIMDRLRQQTATQDQLLREQGVSVPAAAAKTGRQQQEQPPRQEGRPPNPHAMNVVMIGAECAPWSKTGEGYFSPKTI